MRQSIGSHAGTAFLRLGRMGRRWRCRRCSRLRIGCFWICRLICLWLFFSQSHALDPSRASLLTAKHVVGALQRRGAFQRSCDGGLATTQIGLAMRCRICWVIPVGSYLPPT